MKKILLLTFILITTKCFSQDILPITYGPLVSMTSTTFSSDPDFVDQVAGAGYNFGGMVRLKVLFLYAQGEVAYGNKSSSITVSDSGVNSNVTYKLKGMDVTALLGVKLLGLSSVGNIRIFGGYNWNNYSDITYSVDGNSFAASNVNSNNHSLVMGFGVDLLKLSFDLKYIDGFIDLATSQSVEVKSKIVNLTVAYRFK
jgi:hypothetical protein